MILTQNHAFDSEVGKQQGLVVSLKKEVDRIIWSVKTSVFLSFWGLGAAATRTEEIKWENDKKFQI